MSFPISRYNYGRSAHHLVEVRVYIDEEWITLPLQTGVLTFDEDNEFITAEIQTPVPTDEIVESIDPRALPQMSIWLGYELTNGVREFEEVCRLDIRERHVERPANVMRLFATGREGRIHDSASVVRSERLTFYQSTSAGQAIKALIEKHDPGATVINELPYISFLEAEESPYTEPVGEDPWVFIQEILDRAGGVAYWDGFVWRIHKDSAYGSESSVLLTPREGGNILGYSARLGRDDRFYNSVTVSYRWTDDSDVEQERTATATVTAGPLGVTAAGRKHRLIVKNYPGSYAGAQKAANTLVNRTITRGREIIVTALSAYWLRPFQTIQITTVPGKVEKHLVKYVQFTLESGQMNIKTRRPEDVTIVEEEA